MGIFQPRLRDNSRIQGAFKSRILVAQCFNRLFGNFSSSGYTTIHLVSCTLTKGSIAETSIKNLVTASIL